MPQSRDKNTVLGDIEVSRDTISSRVHRVWAKTSKKETGPDEESRYHPLLCHMLDVAAVAGLVWDNHLTEGVRKRLGHALNADEQAARSLVVFAAGAHDIGKASPGFQKKAPRISECTEMPYSENDRNCPHGFVTASVLSKLLGDGWNLVAQITGGHHGVFPRASDLRLGRDSFGNAEWENARSRLLEEYSRTIGYSNSQVAADTCDPQVVPVLAGFISVVDWIGSNQDFFPCVAECDTVCALDPAQYWQEADDKARKALTELGWLPAVTFAEEVRFDQVFTGFSPNSLQASAIELVQNQNDPYLMIVEAPMGKGKTEAALYAADVALCRGFARGMYIAMPTQATGNAMFKRVLDNYLRNRGHKGKLNLQLVHGDALLAHLPEVEEGEIPGYSPTSIGDDEADVHAQSWFTAKKRPLLAPFGVGTIDQSLLSVLQTKHWFVRMFGLAGKVVVFDEVHAYDAYMSTILERLLHWLAELDCTVILLSATLPEAKRKQLVKAYSGRDDPEYKRYPRITLVKPRHYLDEQSPTVPVCVDIPMEEPRSVELQFAKTSLDTLPSTLGQRLQQGGCAAVICTTVDRAIEVYKHLRDTLDDTECMLFHARTLQMWRREREAEVLHKFGKRDPQEKDAKGYYVNPDRPHRAVLVATQVVEQSLDLDFDLMVSDMAPIDLLIQRSGRLHRHARRRPPCLESPGFIVLCDADRNGAPPESFGGSIEYVYDRYILLRTWLALRGRKRLDMPTEIEHLVEAVYGEVPSVTDDTWEDALFLAHVVSKVTTDDCVGHARQIILRQPDDPLELVERFNRTLEDDDDPATEHAVRAATRDGLPSIRTVFLRDGESPPRKIGNEEARWLTERSAPIHKKALYEKLLSMKVPANWDNNAHLRYCRLVQVGNTKGIQVDLTKELGVVIT